MRSQGDPVAVVLCVSECNFLHEVKAQAFQEPDAVRIFADREGIEPFDLQRGCSICQNGAADFGSISFVPVGDGKCITKLRIVISCPVIDTGSADDLTGLLICHDPDAVFVKAVLLIDIVTGICPFLIRVLVEPFGI